MTVLQDPLSRFTKRRQRSVTALDKIRGLEMTDGYRGLLKCGELIADVLLESVDSICVTLPMRRCCQPLEALEAGHYLSGNVRFAGNAGEFSLVADTRMDGEAHLPQTFRDVATSFGRAVDGKQGVRRRRSPQVAAAAAAALNQMNWPQDSVVPLQEGWEIRPRCRRRVWPLRLETDGGGLRLFHSVLDQIPDAAAQAVAEHSLRLNRRIRLARLAPVHGKLVLEARLHRGQITADWISITAHAMAAALAHTGDSLRVLADNESIADGFTSMFFHHEPVSAGCRRHGRAGVRPK